MMNSIPASRRSEIGDRAELGANPNSPLVANAPLVWFIASAVIFLIELIVRGKHGAFKSRGPEIYWAFHWASDYSNGFVRRGLLGAALRLLNLDNSSFALITFLSFSVSIALYAVYMFALFRLVRHLSRLELTFAAVILALSPMTAGMIIETTGDPLQLLMLCFLCLFLLVVVPERAAGISFLSFTALGAMGALIHEASLFFLLPTLAVAAFLLHRTNRARAAFFGYLLGSVVLTGVIVLTTQKSSGTIAHLPVLHYHRLVEVMPVNEFPKFTALLAIENRANFGHGVKGDLLTLLRLIGVLTLPVLLLSCFTALFYGQLQSSSATRFRLYLAFLIPLLLSCPLYIIGHDWGRFSSYTFMLTLSILPSWRNDTSSALPSEPQIPFAFGLLVAGLTLAPLPTGYILTGMLYSRINYIGTVLLLCLLLAQSYRYWKANLG